MFCLLNDSIKEKSAKVALLLLCAVSGANVLAASMTLKSVKPLPNDGDYLNHITYRGGTEKNLNQVIFDKSIVDEMTSRFRSYDDAYAFRQNYGLNDSFSAMDYSRSSKDLADWTLKKLLQYHLQHSVQKKVEAGVRREAKESKSAAVQGAAKTVTAIADFQ